MNVVSSRSDPDRQRKNQESKHGEGRIARCFVEMCFRSRNRVVSESTRLESRMEGEENLKCNPLSRKEGGACVDLTHCAFQ